MFRQHEIKTKLSSRTHHESSKIFVEHAQQVARTHVLNPSLVAMRLPQWAQL